MNTVELKAAIADLDEAIKRLTRTKRRLEAQLPTGPRLLGTNEHVCAGTTVVPDFCAHCGRPL